MKFKIIRHDKDFKFFAEMLNSESIMENTVIIDFGNAPSIDGDSITSSIVGKVIDIYYCCDSTTIYFPDSFTIVDGVKE